MRDLQAIVAEPAIAAAPDVTVSTDLLSPTANMPCMTTLAWLLTCHVLHTHITLRLTEKKWRDACVKG